MSSTNRGASSARTTEATAREPTEATRKRARRGNRKKKVQQRAEEQQPIAIDYSSSRREGVISARDNIDQYGRQQPHSLSQLAMMDGGSSLDQQIAQLHMQDLDQSAYGAPPSFVVNSQSTLNPNAPPFVPMSSASVVEEEDEEPITSLGSHIEPHEVEPANKYNNLRERLIDQLTHERYECMICSDYIRRSQPTWSCSKCYAVFHFSATNYSKSCITKWARKSDEANAGQWRCPGCQNVNAHVPKKYFCFCGKETRPANRRGDTPHSCGNVCGVTRGLHCTHPCTEPCHPGPCPPCSAHINQSCRCKRHTRRVVCSSILDNSEYICPDACCQPLTCTSHDCEDVCHSGDCAPCRRSIELVCHCGQRSKGVPCNAANKDSTTYSCAEQCHRMFECGEHRCDQLCHEGECGLCPYHTDKLTHCACGGTRLTSLPAVPARSKCTDPVPLCDDVCYKVFKCGPLDAPHRCELACHEGKCTPCAKDTPMRCRCMATTELVDCAQAVVYRSTGNPLLCGRRCKRIRTCRVHRCNEFCCTADEHMCLQLCGKRLSCALHNCESLCHAGNCRPCLQADFSDQSCLCGGTVRAPPIPCGASPPVCHLPCTRQHPCAHDVHHACHSEENCPPCTHLITAWCMGAHQMRNNIACHLRNDVSCGRRCDKMLEGCDHKCVRLCHSGPCALTDHCQQSCPIASRVTCDHLCALVCHYGEKCPPSECKAMVNAQCGCGYHTQRMQCREVDMVYRRRRAVGQGGDVMDVGKGVQRLKCLLCDDRCSINARNTAMADALRVSLDTVATPVVYTELLQRWSTSQPRFVSNVQNQLIKVVQELQLYGQSSRAYSFEAMRREERQFVHEYAAYFRLETNSFDPEPQRTVTVTAKRGTSLVPSRLLIAIKPTMNSSAQSSGMVALTKTRPILQRRGSPP